MKKILQVCFIAAMVFGLASCSKDDNGNGSSTDTQVSLVGTTWGFNDGEAEVRVSFETASQVKVKVQTPHGTENYEGTYTYSNGNGSMALIIQGQTLNITFTVSGNTMTAHNTPAGDVTLTLVGSNPQPQPGGDYPLNGTTWQTSFQEEGLYITMGVSFGTTNCLLVYSDSEGDSDQATGTYTYSGTITSGRGTITIRGDEVSFTVNGNEAAITADGETHVFTRVNQ